MRKHDFALNKCELRRVSSAEAEAKGDLRSCLLAASAVFALNVKRDRLK